MFIKLFPETVQVTEGPQYFPRGPHVAQLWRNRMQSAKRALNLKPGSAN